MESWIKNFAESTRRSNRGTNGKQAQGTKILQGGKREIGICENTRSMRTGIFNFSDCSLVKREAEGFPIRQNQNRQIVFYDLSIGVLMFGEQMIFL